MEEPGRKGTEKRSTAYSYIFLFFFACCRPFDNSPTNSHGGEDKAKTWRRATSRRGRQEVKTDETDSKVGAKEKMGGGSGVVFKRRKNRMAKEKVKTPFRRG